MYEIIIIQPNGDRSFKKQDATPNCDTISELIGGLLEIVPHFDRFGSNSCVAFCDEEGKLKGLKLNGAATYLWWSCMAHEGFRPDTLHGPLVIITADDPALLERL